mgnify:CR=1 FL=1
MNVAIEDDLSTDGGGGILPEGTFPTVTVEGKGIAIANTQTPAIGAGSDDQCSDGNAHCTTPGASQGSPDVTAGGNSVHRVGDSRECGGFTASPTLIRTVNVN